MSLYNAINGFNPACVIIMPMLGRKQNEYPRFRDCFVEDGKIAIFTRVGGGNRGCGFGEEELYKDPNYVTSYDDDFDCTYATYLFNVPKEWKDDFDCIMDNRFADVSDKYVDYLKQFYPLLAENGIIDSIFRKAEGEE